MNVSMFNERWRYSVRSVRCATRFDRYSVYVSPSLLLQGSTTTADNPVVLPSIALQPCCRGSARE
eukprot:5110896-Alexandrium_andersonii.AAC.1